METKDETKTAAPPAAPRILWAKIVKGLFLHATYTQELPGHANKSIDIESTVPIHDDLKKAFTALDPHLAFMCDQEPLPKNAQAFDQAAAVLLEAETYTTRSFSLSGDGDAEGVVLSGGRSIALGNLNLNTTFQKFLTTEYKYMGQLSADIQICINEVEQYLFQGKKAPTMEQGTLDMPDSQLEHDDNEGEAPAGPKAKKSAAKKDTTKGKLKAVAGNKKEEKIK